MANEFGADSFDVVLDKAPGTNVVLSLSSSDTNIATLDKANLAFSPTNWNVPQRVIFRPVDNHVINPDQVINITVSVVAALSDNAYDPVATQLFAATIRNDDFAPADYDHNGLVEQADYDTWRANYGGTANTTLAADGNGNGTVDAGDYVFWRKKMSTPAAGAAAGAGAALSTAVASSTLNETPAVDDRPATDAAFAGLADDSWKVTDTAVNAGNPSTIFSSPESDVVSSQTELLLVLRDPGTSDQSADTENQASNDPFEQLADADFATTLAADWPSID